MTHAEKTDLHMHTVVSDGTDTPEELLEKVKEAGITVFAVTDHDAVKAGKAIRARLKAGDPAFIQGAEFSCRDENGKYHILGYGFDPDHAAMRGLIEHGHALRVKKVAARIDFLASEFGFAFTERELKDLFALDNPGKPHIGNLMVKHGYARTKKQAIDEYINRMRFRSEYVRPEEAIEGIISAGGIPVLAHPFYGSGDELILGAEMDERIKRLAAMGLKGLEAYYSGFTAKLRGEALELAERHGLYVTAGSDYHGANKMVELGDTGLGVGEEYPGPLKRFLEIFGA